MNRLAVSSLNLLTRAFSSTFATTATTTTRTSRVTGSIFGGIQQRGGTEPGTILGAIRQRLNVFDQLDSLQIRCAQYGREYQPNNLQRKRKHGYLKRKRTAAGRKILEARKAKGRKWLSH